VPGYDSPRKPGRETGDPADPPWRGSAAGKGPVRGYPPLPGQPPPMYPPGQFAAWNRRGQDQATQSAASGQDGQGRPAGLVPGAARAGYYGRDGEDHTEPGYSTLAISDPAADVTSTQTWQAVGDGRATGIWSAPSRPADARPEARAAGAGPGQLHPDADLLSGQPADASGRPAPADRQAPADSQQAPADRQPDPRGSGRHGSIGASRSAGSDLTGRTARTARSDHAAVDDRAAGTGRAAGTSRAAGTGRARSGRGGAGRRGKHPISVKLAVSGALAIALIAGVVLYLAGTRATAPHTASPAHKTATKAAAPTPTPTPTATLGPYGYIGSRHEDPQPLTIAQLYPPSFTAANVSYVKTKSKLSSDCLDAVNGAGIQGAVGSSVCSQVARATYLASKTGMMGTIGVLNLKTAHDASVAAHATGATDFIAQLAGRKAPTSKIGHGAGIEEALAKGHYLILIWAELTSLKTPHKAAQRAGLEQFMTQLLDGTANVSLTNRMINGSPSPAPGA
jgi:hypothetical protein